MKNFDPAVPNKLKRTQQWFGGIIGRAIDEDNKINPITPSGSQIQLEAQQYILPSPTLEPWQRIQIYNQQYWWRLIKILHEHYPLVIRLFGYHDFNQTIAIPYLEKYPPNSWSLNPLGSRLPHWIEEEYHENDQSLVLDAAKVDNAFNDSFVVEEFLPLSASSLPNGDMQALLGQKITLQKHVTLFYFPYDLFSFRAKILEKDVEYWIENDFPKLENGDFYFVHYRNLENNLSWEEISNAEYFLLSLFQKGTTIDEACDLLEEQEKEIRTEAAKNLGDWFHLWASRHWLS